MSHNAPMALYRNSSTDTIPTSRLSRSKLFAASSRAKGVDAGSYGSIHRSKGAPHAGEPLPTKIRVRDDSPSASSAANPFGHDASAETPPPALEGVSGAGASLSPSTMTSGDPLTMSPSD